MARFDPLAAGPDYTGAALDRLNAISFELTSIFSEAGFAPAEPVILQPADLLFRLYGEEIWDRAFVVPGEGDGDWCLRPDFTVPVARMHLDRVGPVASAGVEARYGYFGPVFRRSREGGTEPLQHLQSGVEAIARRGPDPVDDAAREAEVFVLAQKAMTWCAPEAVRGAETVTGDLGVVFTLLDQIALPPGWRRRLKRHVWRPARFQNLLRGFAGDAAPDAASRLAFLKAVGGMAPEEAAGVVREMLTLAEIPQIGLRDAEAVAERFLAQAADAQGHPLPGETAALIDAVLAVRGPSDRALAALRDLAADGGVDLSAPLDRMARRLDALAAAGVAPESLAFDASFGRNLEYYDGFVFEVTAAASDGARRKLCGGGRYDRLFAALGAGEPFSAMGVALRPEALAHMAEMQP